MSGVAATAGRPRRPSRGGDVGVAICYAVLIVIALLSVVPLLVMIVDSVKSNSQIATSPAGLPVPLSGAGYQQLVRLGQMHNFLNSIMIAVLTTAGAVLLSALAAYGFAKLRFPGRNVIFFGLIATIMVPPQTAMPGFYAEFTTLGWLNTYRIQIVPFLAPVFGLFMLRQVLLRLPDSILEAARLDGASEWRIFWRVALPMMKPALGALAVLEFLTSWSNYLWPSVMASNGSVAPFSVSLTTLTDPSLGLVPLYGPIMAGCVLATVPLILVFLRFQRTFMAGISYEV